MTDPEWIESDEDVQPTPAPPIKQVEKSKPAAGGKKAAAKAAAAQKQAPAATKATAESAGGDRSGSANARDLQKQREELKKKQQVQE